VLYNKFNVNYNTSDPTVPENPSLYRDPRYECVIARKHWKVARCSEEHHVVCQKGLTLHNVMKRFRYWCRCHCLVSYCTYDRINIVSLFTICTKATCVCLSLSTHCRQRYNNNDTRLHKLLTETTNNNCRPN